MLDSAFRLGSPRVALAAQCAVLAAVIAVAEFAPRPGQTTLYLPLVAADRHAALDWALAQGAALNGTGPLGGLILKSPPAGFAMRALREGALAIAVPSAFCQPLKALPHG